MLKYLSSRRFSAKNKRGEGDSGDDPNTNTDSNFEEQAKAEAQANSNEKSKEEDEAEDESKTEEELKQERSMKFIKELKDKYGDDFSFYDYESEDEVESLFTDDEPILRHSTGDRSKLFFPEGHGKNLDLSDFRRPLPDNLNLKWVRFNRELNDYLVEDLTSEQLKDFRVYLINFVTAYHDEDTTHLHDWAKAANAIKAKTFCHDIMCVSVNDPFVILDMARKLGYEDRISFIADWDCSMTKWLKSEYETEYMGLKSRRSAGVMTEGLLRVKFYSFYLPLMYSYSVSPKYMWKYIYDPMLRVRLFL